METDYSLDAIRAIADESVKEEIESTWVCMKDAARRGQTSLEVSRNAISSATLRYFARRGFDIIFVYETTYIKW